MQNIPDKEDEQWLNALAGHTDPGGDAKSNMQAQALRRALQARAEKLEAMVPFAGEVQYQALVKRLQSEKLLPAKEGWRNSPIWIKTTGVLGISSDVIPWKNPIVLGLTATLVVGFAIVMNIQTTGTPRSEADVLRSGKGTTLIVAEPEARLQELLPGLIAAGENPVIERLGNGSIAMTIKASPEVMDYLATQRVAPIVVDGKATLLLMRPKASQPQ